MTLSRSRFPWEQEALDLVFERFPAQDNYRAWANFEFIADDGSINEVDLLVACPQGIFLIEIKSNPGTLRGDTLSWTWEHEGRRKTVENPLLLANRKCKRLKSLLVRQRAFKKEAQPFIEPIVFLSQPNAKCLLSGVAVNNVRLTTREHEDDLPRTIRTVTLNGSKYFSRTVQESRPLAFNAVRVSVPNILSRFHWHRCGRCAPRSASPRPGR